MDALTSAFQDAERGRLASKVMGGDIGRALAVASNWVSPAYALLSENAERYLYGYRDWTYVCVNTIAKRVAGQAINIARPSKRSRRGTKAFNRPLGTKAFVNGLNVLDSHPFLDAVHEPNSVMVRWSLIFSTVASLLITGESHWWLSDENGKTQIWPLPSHWIRPADPIRSAWIIRPWYSAEEWTVPADRIAYFNLPDPANPFLSVSPVARQVHAINADESIQTAQDQTFRNGMFPGLAVIAGNPLDPTGDGPRPTLDTDQKAQIMDSLRKMYQGAGRYNSAIILDSLIRDIKPLSNKPAEMDFQESSELIKKRIFHAFGVNPVIAGELENVNYSSAFVAHELFAEQVCNPLMTLLSECMTRWVVPVFSGGDDGLVAWFEPCVASSPEITDKRWEMLAKLGMTSRDETRFGVLGLPPGKGDDVYMTPMNLSPDPVNAKPEEAKPADDDDAGDKEKPDDKPDDDDDGEQDDKNKAAAEISRIVRVCMLKKGAA